MRQRSRKQDVDGNLVHDLEYFKSNERKVMLSRLLGAGQYVHQQLVRESWFAQTGQIAHNSFVDDFYGFMLKKGIPEVGHLEIPALFWSPVRNVMPAHCVVCAVHFCTGRY